MRVVQFPAGFHPLDRTRINWITSVAFRFEPRLISLSLCPVALCLPNSTRPKGLYRTSPSALRKSDRLASSSRRNQMPCFSRESKSQE